MAVPENDNIKKILCCTGAVVQKSAENEIDATEAADYVTACQDIIGAVEYRINQDIPRPDPGDDESITVLLFSGAVADAMGRLAGMEAEFGAVYQPEIDAFASAADAVVAG